MVLTNTYDELGRRTQLAATMDGTADFVNDYQFDALSRMTQVTQHGETGGAAVSDKRVDFTYNDLGQFDTITRYADLAGAALVATSNYTYDDLSRLTGLTHSQDTTTLADYAWTYDANSRVTAFTNSVHSSEDATYSYDTTNQLTAADRAGTTDDESFSYDENGNRTISGYTIGTNNQILSDGTYNYQYDAEGNRTRKANIATGDYTVYEWDSRNRLVSIEFRDSSDALTKRVVYKYDVFDRRISKQVDDNGDGVFDRGEHYVYDEAGKLDPATGVSLDDIVLVFDGSGSLTNRYLRGPAIDQILADERFDATTHLLDDIYWPLADNQGTIRDIATYDDALDETAIADHLTYNAFGEITDQSDPSTGFVYGYAGYDWDVDAGLYFTLYRPYDPMIGQFLLEDPLGIAAGDSNFRRYVRNAATVATDATGLKAQWHHLLPRQFRALFEQSGFRIDHARWGWIIDAEYHVNGKKCLHPRWNTEWYKFFDKYEKGVRVPQTAIIKQFNTMMKDFDFLLKNGKQATLTHQEWGSWLAKMRRSAARARKTGSSVTLKITRKIGKVTKVVGILTFVYIAACDGVAVAAEQGTRDALWPFIDIAEEAGAIAGDLTDALIRKGTLGRRQTGTYIQRMMRDPHNAPIPAHAGGLRGAR